MANPKRSFKSTNSGGIINLDDYKKGLKSKNEAKRNDKPADNTHISVREFDQYEKRADERHQQLVSRQDEDRLNSKEDRKKADERHQQLVSIQDEDRKKADERHQQLVSIQDEDRKKADERHHQLVSRQDEDRKKADERHQQLVSRQDEERERTDKKIENESKSTKRHGTIRTIITVIGYMISAIGIIWLQKILT